MRAKGVKAWDRRSKGLRSDQVLTLRVSRRVEGQEAGRRGGQAERDTVRRREIGTILKFVPVLLIEIGTRLLGFCRPCRCVLPYIDSYRDSAESQAREREL